MKNYVKEYKGFTVPEGATHYNEANILWPKCFIDAKYGRIDKMDGNGWVLSEKTMPITAIPLPEVDEKKMDYRNPLLKNKQEWMPKVGCAYEVRFKDGAFRHRDVCKIIAIGKEWCVFETSDKKERSCKISGLLFRPLKARQEKDREAFIDTARKATNADENDVVATDIFDDMFHAGFTAPKDGDNDK